jgi:hypothetical protein
VRRDFDFARCIGAIAAAFAGDGRDGRAAA